MSMILVSSCLLGEPVRYDGSANTLDAPVLHKWRAEGRLVPFCPECAAGLPTPRPPAEIATGHTAGDVLDGLAKVHDIHGNEVTEAFVEGARLALKTAQQHGCRFALLKEGSPSCASDYIHSGRFDAIRRPGRGLTAELLDLNGIAVFSEHQLDKLAEALAG